MRLANSMLRESDLDEMHCRDYEKTLVMFNDLFVCKCAVVANFS